MFPTLLTAPPEEPKSLVLDLATEKTVCRKKTHARLPRQHSWGGSTHMERRQMRQFALEIRSRHVRQTDAAKATELDLNVRADADTASVADCTMEMTVWPDTDYEDEGDDLVERRTTCSSRSDPTDGDAATTATASSTPTPQSLPQSPTGYSGVGLKVAVQDEAVCTAELEKFRQARDAVGKPFGFAHHAISKTSEESPSNAIEHNVANAGPVYPFAAPESPPNPRGYPALVPAQPAAAFVGANVPTVICAPPSLAHTKRTEATACFGMAPLIPSSVILSDFPQASQQQESSSEMADGSPSMKSVRDQKIFVGGVPQELTQEDLYALFSQFAPVKKAWLQKLREPDETSVGDGQRAHRGFGFIIFRAADAVLKLLGNESSRFITTPQGLQLEVKRAVSSSKLNSSAASKAQRHSPNEGKQVFQQRDPVSQLAPPMQSISQDMHAHAHGPSSFSTRAVWRAPR